LLRQHRAEVRRCRRNPQQYIAVVNDEQLTTRTGRRQDEALPEKRMGTISDRYPF